MSLRLSIAASLAALPAKDDSVSAKRKYASDPTNVPVKRRRLNEMSAKRNRW